jgi:hypothetical protein
MLSRTTISVYAGVYDTLVDAYVFKIHSISLLYKHLRRLCDNKDFIDVVINLLFQYSFQNI